MKRTSKRKYSLGAKVKNERMALPTAKLMRNNRVVEPSYFKQEKLHSKGCSSNETSWVDEINESN